MTSPLTIPPTTCRTNKPSTIRMCLMLMKFYTQIASHSICYLFTMFSGTFVWHMLNMFISSPPLTGSIYVICDGIMSEYEAFEARRSSVRRIMTGDSINRWWQMNRFLSLGFSQSVLRSGCLMGRDKFHRCQYVIQSAAALHVNCATEDLSKTFLDMSAESEARKRQKKNRQTSIFPLLLLGQVPALLTTTIFWVVGVRGGGDYK